MRPEEIVFILKSLASAVPDNTAFGAVARAMVGQSAATAPAPSAPAAAPVAAPVGEVEIHKGQLCECTECKAKVYEIIEDVRANMKISAFMACFKPLNGATPLTTATDIWGDPYGNAAIDCPLCKGRKTVWIKGKGTYDDIPENAQ